MNLENFEPTPHFECEAQRETALYDLCLSAFSVEALDALVNMGFLTAPASTKYHGSYPGGLFDHCYGVATSLQTLTQQLGLKWDNPQSPIRIGILHDLCKLDQYEWQSSTETYSFKDNTLLTGHGIKSVVLAQQLPGVNLTVEEIACIVYHMGAFTEKSEWKSYTNAIHKFPNVLWVHTADMVAAHILEVDEHE